MGDSDTDSTSSDESFYFPVDFPAPTFEDHFQSYFKDVVDQDEIKRSVLPFSKCWYEFKKNVTKITVTGRTPVQLDTVSLADVHRDVKQRVEQGKDVILYPVKNLADWPKLRLLRADYTERDDKVCAMAWACFTGDVKAINQLVAFGSYVDRQLPNGNTLMMEAVVGQADTRCTCIEILLKAGARINIQNQAGHTVVTAAAWAGDVQVLKLLMGLRTVNINHRTTRGSTALILAVARQHEDMVHHLVDNCGADLLPEDEVHKVLSDTHKEQGEVGVSQEKRNKQVNPEKMVKTDLLGLGKAKRRMAMPEGCSPCDCDCCIYRAGTGPCLGELLDPNYNPEDWCMNGACPCKNAAFDAEILQEMKKEKGRLGIVAVPAKPSLPTHNNNNIKNKDCACDGDTCVASQQLDTSGQITSYVTGNVYESKYNVDCTSSNLIYCISCNLCGMQYVGLSARSIGIRISDIHGMIEREAKHEVSLHMNICSTRYEDKHLDMMVHILDFVFVHPQSKRASYLRKRIKQNWMQRLHTKSPEGLNGGPPFSRIK